MIEADTNTEVLEGFTLQAGYPIQRIALKQHDPRRSCRRLRSFDVVFSRSKDRSLRQLLQMIEVDPNTEVLEGFALRGLSRSANCSETARSL